MTQSIILVEAAKLTKSPSNVRKSSEPQADAQLEASIVAHGILQNLIGLPVARKKGHYRITAGGRRLDAVHRAIERGDLPADFELPVMVVTDANDAVEISLSENFFKLAMLGHVVRAVLFGWRRGRADRRANPKSWRRSACPSHRAAMLDRGVTALRRSNIGITPAGFSPVRLVDASAQ